MIEPTELVPLLNNQAKLDPLLLSLYGTTTEEKFINKQILNRTKVFITERLTAHPVVKLKEAKEKFDFKNGWSNESRIMYKDNGDDKIEIYFDWQCGVILRRKKLKSGFL